MYVYFHEAPLNVSTYIHISVYMSYTSGKANFIIANMRTLHLAWN